ncbi:MAG: acyltransferase [Gammaproteobacteria bacterium]|nr:acyltransferase [Gammaproteobacteria bacterium]MBU2435841.1 acyltransferase [Gammaproteobacteria bacterium]MBU2449378.1 acyltransferase [Gammaproteobacteria bacterium]
MGVGNVTSPQESLASGQLQARRLVELDALRGIAAIVVMFFHYTTRYDQLYGHETATTFSLPWGHYGVNLFFMISGFVIFMTLHRIRRPLDFIVSRFSRLFPAFWIAVVVTFVLTHAMGLPDKGVGAGTAFMNLFMIHGLLNIPHVDGVYWTLEIELLFYAMALTLYLLGRLDKVHFALMALLALRLSYFLALKFADIEMSWTLSHLLILPYIAWFVCGVMVYRRVSLPYVTPIRDRALLLSALVLMAVVDGPGIGLLAAGLSFILWAAALGKLPWLANPVFAWLGAISYTLYLLHENIGWGLMLHAERAGLSSDLAIVLATALALAMATALTKLVEVPAMKWIRENYRRRSWPEIHASKVFITLVALFSVLAGFAHAWHQAHPLQARPGDSVEQVFQPTELLRVPCPLASESNVLRILVLGQSNAGNHGAVQNSGKDSMPALFFYQGACYETTGPAPGATGQGGNLWVHVGPLLAEATKRPVVISVLAVDATRVRDWVNPGRLRETLIQGIADQREHGFVPDVVLWQQGEADGKAGTTNAKYREQFGLLVALLRAQGVSAPIMVALSTRCRNEGSDTVRSALKAVASFDKTVRIGPDTDLLAGEYRWDDCHFSSLGLEAAAHLWTRAFMSER